MNNPKFKPLNSPTIDFALYDKSYWYETLLTLRLLAHNHNSRFRSNYEDSQLSSSSPRSRKYSCYSKKNSFDCNLYQQQSDPFPAYKRRWHLNKPLQHPFLSHQNLIFSKSSPTKYLLLLFFQFALTCLTVAYLVPYLKTRKSSSFHISDSDLILAPSRDIGGFFPVKANPPGRIAPPKIITKRQTSHTEGADRRGGGERNSRLKSTAGTAGAGQPMIPIITAMRRTTFFAYDCHEGTCEAPEIPAEPIPIFSAIPTRIRLSGVGFPYPDSHTPFRIAFARYHQDAIKPTSYISSPTAAFGGGQSLSPSFSEQSTSSISPSSPEPKTLGGKIKGVFQRIGVEQRRGDNETTLKNSPDKDKASDNPLAEYDPFYLDRFVGHQMNFSFDDIYMVCDDYIVTEVFKPVSISHGALDLAAANARKTALSGFPNKLRGGKYILPVSIPGSLDVDPSLSPDRMTANYLLFDINLQFSEHPYELCFKYSNSSLWRFASPDILKSSHARPWLQIKTYQVKSRYLLPLWLELTLVVILFCLSGLFSGLNLGLMSLDQTELRLLEKSGSPNEKRCSSKIMPLRRRGNFLLCTLVFGNVLVNSTLTILIENLSSGRVAVIVSTIGITLFGEIIPQAVCAKYGLEIGAKTVWITKFFMFITAPLAYPISLILDKILGEDIGSVYDRQRLIELVKLSAEFGGTASLGKEEVDIITGALIMKNKTVGQIMTPIRDIYMVAYESCLDFATLTDIVSSGYTRIPVFKGGDHKNIVGVLNVKDLAFVDPDDKIPLKTVLDFYDHAVTYVYDDTLLGSILEEFKKGSSHMAFVRKIIAQPDKDPYYEIIGLVTLEDVIEEIIQGEILDETDRLLDNQNKQIRQQRKMHDFSLFLRSGIGGKATENELIDSPMTPQMALVTFQFLHANIDPFNETYVSQNVLRKLIRQPEILQIFSTKNDEELVYKSYWNPSASEMEKPNQIYTKDVVADYFMLILEGRVRVFVGSENICFESGPFTYFGVNSLKALANDEKLSASLKVLQCSSETLNQILKSIPSYVPDFSVYPLSSLLYLKIKRTQYLAALRATALERLAGSSSTATGGGGSAGTGAPNTQIISPSLAVMKNIDRKNQVDSKTRETGTTNITKAANKMMMNKSPILESKTSQLLDRISENEDFDGGTRSKSTNESDFIFDLSSSSNNINGLDSSTPVNHSSHTIPLIPTAATTIMNNNNSASPMPKISSFLNGSAFSPGTSPAVTRRFRHTRRLNFPYSDKFARSPPISEEELEEDDDDADDESPNETVVRKKGEEEQAFLNGTNKSLSFTDQSSGHAAAADEYINFDELVKPLISGGSVGRQLAADATTSLKNASTLATKKSSQGFFLSSPSPSTTTTATSKHSFLPPIFKRGESFSSTISNSDKQTSSYHPLDTVGNRFFFRPRALSNSTSPDHLKALNSSSPDGSPKSYASCYGLPDGDTLRSNPQTTILPLLSPMNGKTRPSPLSPTVASKTNLSRSKSISFVSLKNLILKPLSSTFSTSICPNPSQLIIPPPHARPWAPPSQGKLLEPPPYAQDTLKRSDEMMRHLESQRSPKEYFFDKFNDNTNILPSSSYRQTRRGTKNYDGTMSASLFDLFRGKNPDGVISDPSTIVPMISPPSKSVMPKQQSGDNNNIYTSTTFQTQPRTFFPDHSIITPSLKKISNSFGAPPVPLPSTTTATQSDVQSSNDSQRHKISSPTFKDRSRLLTD